MAVAILILFYSAFVGAMGYLFYLGLKSAVLGGGYWLFGGRESFGWGARVAGILLMLPLLASMIYWIVAFLTGYATGEEIARGQKWLAPIVLAGVSSLAFFLVSYVLGEFTYTPYWVFSRQGAEAGEEEVLTEHEKKRRLMKLERKRARAREREERMRREREEEQQRLKIRHEQAKLKKAPPPLPLSEDERRLR